MSIDFFDTSFYDKESINYSENRYLSKPNTYNKFFFQNRLNIILKMIDKYIKYQKNQTIIEDGCADGFVIKNIINKYKSNFSSAIGIDISPGMIDKAKSNTNQMVKYYIKDNFNENIKADIFLAIGFVSPGIFHNEFDFINLYTRDNSIVVLSLPSNNSLFARLKGREIHKDYWDFNKYEEFIKKKFEILDSKAYGLFIPKLWAFPRLAMILQPIFENLFSPLLNLFHEKLYILKKRG